MRVEIWLPLAALVLGWAGSQATEVFRDRRIYMREQRAREQAAQDERRNRREQFQRETLLALQDVLPDLYKAVARDQDEKLRVYKESGTWPVRAWGDPVPNDWSDARARLNKLRPRIFDDKLRDIASKLRDESLLAVTAQTEGDMWEKVRSLDELASQAHERIGSLLRDLY